MRSYLVLWFTCFLSQVSASSVVDTALESSVGIASDEQKKRDFQEHSEDEDEDAQTTQASQDNPELHDVHVFMDIGPQGQISPLGLPGPQPKETGQRKRITRRRSKVNKQQVAPLSKGRHIAVKSSMAMKSSMASLHKHMGKSFSQIAQSTAETPSWASLMTPKAVRKGQFCYENCDASTVKDLGGNIVAMDPGWSPRPSNGDNFADLVIPGATYKTCSQLHLVGTAYMEDNVPAGKSNGVIFELYHGSKRLISLKLEGAAGSKKNIDVAITKEKLTVKVNDRGNGGWDWFRVKAEFQCKKKKELEKDNKEDDDNIKNSALQSVAPIWSLLLLPVLLHAAL